MEDLLHIQFAEKMMHHQPVHKAMLACLSQEDQKNLQDFFVHMERVHNELDMLEKEGMRINRDDMDAAYDLKVRWEGLQQDARESASRCKRYLWNVAWTDAARECAAKEYFGQFDTCREVFERFVERRKRVIRALTQDIQNWCTHDEDFKRFFLRNFRHVLLERRGELRRRDWSVLRDSLACVVVYGSSAIGPRTSTYMRDQDIDMFLVPDIAKTKEEDRAFVYQALSFFADFLTSISKRDDTKDAFSASFPALSALQKEGIDFSLDVHVPSISSDEPLAWHKLAGPHVVGEFLTPTAEQSYRLFLDHYFTAARTENLARKIEVYDEE